MKMVSFPFVSATIVFAALALSLIGPIVLAGTGSLRISPAMPMTVNSPASFETWVQGNVEASDPHIFLVMTDSCHSGLTANVKVEWVGGSLTIPATAWASDDSNGNKLPPEAAPGAWYTVGSLKSHLATTQQIWWTFQPFLDGQNITQTPRSFSVTLSCNDPRMLVYVLGKDAPGEYDMSVPETIPGFVVFEPAPVFAALAMLGAFMVYAIKRRKT